MTAVAKLTSTMVNFIFDDGILANYELTKLFFGQSSSSDRSSSNIATNDWLGSEIGLAIPISLSDAW